MGRFAVVGPYQDTWQPMYWYPSLLARAEPSEPLKLPFAASPVNVTSLTPREPA